MLKCGKGNSSVNSSKPTLSMDCRVIGERSDAVLRTAMPGNDDAKDRSHNAIRVGA
jgi:hypothetical protein